jgi:hypothetical protein
MQTKSLKYLQKEMNIIGATSEWDALYYDALKRKKKKPVVNYVKKL